MDTEPVICDHKILTLPAQLSAGMLMSGLRQKFKKSFWMESKDIYHEKETLIVIAVCPIAGIEVTNTHTASTFINDQKHEFRFESNEVLWELVDAWIDDLKPVEKKECVYNGLLGYCSYNAVQLAESITFEKYSNSQNDEIPLLRFNLYRYVYIIKKDTEEILLINNHLSSEANELNLMETWLLKEKVSFPSTFSVQQEVMVDCNEADFINKVKKAKIHCSKGDVFQVVLSRKFSIAYEGDSWDFFQKLKEIDASVYQFFMDEDSFQITGTSPEIHFMAVSGNGYINPIAGTYKRSKCAEEESRLEKKLLNDPKEIAEHMMLVDLARNDLNKIANGVHVSQFKSIEKYAHVMHIVSRVKGRLPETYTAFRLIMDVFPAGTLSGAPKYRAMEIIDDLESSSRSFYGGLLGWIGFNKDINTCIIIRSALFENKVMTYRAGAGIVELSVPEQEMEEVNNKLRSISVALEKFKIR